MTRVRLRTAMALGLAAGASVVAVPAGTAMAVPFTNPTPIAIPDSGPASLYPSPVTVSGLSGRISKVTATLSNLSHSCYTDLDVRLVSPARRWLMLTSDAGTCIGDDHVTTLAFDDDASAGVPCDYSAPISSGSYKPTNDPVIGVDAPECSEPLAPDLLPPFLRPASVTTTLSALLRYSTARLGHDEVWNLYVYDDDPEGAGAIGGWTLDVTIAPPSSSQTLVAGLARNGGVLKALRRGNGDGGSLALQWMRCDAAGDACEAIAGASGSTYRLTSADIARTIRLRVTVTNSGGVGVFDTPHRLIAPRPGRCGNLIEGTSGRDLLAARGFNARLNGLGGDDALRGGPGADCLSGGPGDDRLLGGDGRDYLRGRAGADRLDGGAGPDRVGGGGGDDVLKGGAGRDALNGGPGHDKIYARDGKRETVRCGKGDDRVRADSIDKLIGCEDVRPPR